MEIVDPKIAAYCQQHTTTESPLLRQLNRDTHAQVLQPRMLSGHFQGRFLSMISHMVHPSCILEIGTSTGYSALCLAEGLTPDGKLITIDINEEIESFTSKYLKDSPLKNQIDFRIGDAAEIIPTINEVVDLVFIDADKTNYQKYYDLLIDKVRIGGHILIDNVLWDGKIVNEAARDKKTAAIRAFNDYVQQDPRTENILLPIRDGIMLARKLA
ncbi:MAG: class I SAM-dependent methyltransferase [Spirosomataceae bacterium]